MGCRDRSVDHLKQYGYNIVRLPKADFPPLELLSKGGGALDRFGQLTTVLHGDGSAPVPEIARDVAAPDISGQQSSNLKIGIGLSVLGPVIGAMGGSPLGVKASYEHVATVSFEFVDVLEDSIEVAALDRYLASADVDPLYVQGTRFLEDDEMYVVTATLKSNAVTVRASAGDGAGVKLDVPVLQQAVGGNLDITVTDALSGAITYKGKVPLVFGFQAVQLFYENGVYSAILSAAGQSTRALSAVKSDGAVRYIGGAGMQRIRD